MFHVRYQFSWTLQQIIPLHYRKHHWRCVRFLSYFLTQCNFSASNRSFLKVSEIDSSISFSSNRREYLQETCIVTSITDLNLGDLQLCMMIRNDFCFTVFFFAFGIKWEKHDEVVVISLKKRGNIFFIIHNSLVISSEYTIEGSIFEKFKRSVRIFSFFYIQRTFPQILGKILSFQCTCQFNNGTKE